MIVTSGGSNLVGAARVVGLFSVPQGEKETWVESSDTVRMRSPATERGLGVFQSLGLPDLLIPCVMQSR